MTIHRCLTESAGLWKINDQGTLRGRTNDGRLPELWSTEPYEPRSLQELRHQIASATTSRSESRPPRCGHRYEGN